VLGESDQSRTDDLLHGGVGGRAIGEDPLGSLDEQRLRGLDDCVAEQRQDLGQLFRHVFATRTGRAAHQADRLLPQDVLTRWTRSPIDCILQERCGAKVVLGGSNEEASTLVDTSSPVSDTRGCAVRVFEICVVEGKRIDVVDRHDAQAEIWLGGSEPLRQADEPGIRRTRTETS